MSKVANFPPAFPPAPAVMAIMSRFDRNQLNGFIAVAIDLADAMDGDPDLEDVTNIEDEGIDPLLALEAWPGCEVSDGGDISWIKWTSTQGSQKRGPNLTGDCFGRNSEDDEDCDPAGDAQLTDDSPGFDKADRRLANVYGKGAGCVLSDSDTEHSGEEPETWSSWMDYPRELHIGKRQKPMDRNL